ncbi:prolipoprotein diacylglyceryl transferase [Mycobacterium noviomagense]|uniref:Phosphatidylglycerol--prolipoprotein diacylglyceryl transferase n=1 Tax=Mycobacterium noviomagense TaxID=459858 RepID=A0A7I7PIV0_9MYCO|nr:prolipoprotein diacylglyceryl transferase [Mycobacterium noviomagense]ORB14973.1 prolipoprotein diacylglyceryl transferase [Mycobacterium noviomagense]BBY08558.1 hypothetical protein MNVI_38760 [Mycobacterium noviomagense]
MTTILAYFPSPPRGVWHLGPIPIRAYALFIIVGIVVALLIGDRRWEERGGERGVIYDIALWAVPFGLVGGRLYHLITDWRTYFGGGGAGWAAALRIWDGGLGIWGAVALGGVGAWIACRRRGIPLPAFADAVAPGIVLAQAIGRLGNYFNQELFGRETTLPWGMEVFYRRDPAGFVDVHSLDGVSTGQLAMVVQPTFLYEMLWNILIFAALIYLDRRFTIGHGRLFALYVAGYCIGRFCVELLRDDPATHIAGIRVNLFTSTFVFVAAVVYVMVAPKGREDPATLGGTAGRAEEAPAPEPATELAAVASATGAGDAATLSGQGGDGLVESAETEEAADTAEGGDAAEAAAAEEAEPEEALTEAHEAEEVEPEIVASEVPEAEAAEVEEPEPTAEAEEPETEEPDTEIAGEAPGEQLTAAPEEEVAEQAAPAASDEIAESARKRWSSRLRTMRLRRGRPTAAQSEVDADTHVAKAPGAREPEPQEELKPEEAGDAQPEPVAAAPADEVAEEASLEEPAIVEGASEEPEAEEAEPEEAAAEVEEVEPEAEEAEPGVEEPEEPEEREAATAETTGSEETEAEEPEREAEPVSEPTAEPESKPEVTTSTPQPVTADSRITRWSSRLRNLRRQRWGGANGR